MSTTIASNTKHGSSSPDAEQSQPPSLHWGRLPIARVLAVLLTSALALNKIHILCINELLSEPAVLHSQVLTRVQDLPSPGNNIYDTFPIGTRPGYSVLLSCLVLGYFDLSNMDLSNKSKYLPLPEDRSRANSHSAMSYYKIRQCNIVQNRRLCHCVIYLYHIPTELSYCSVVL